MHSGNPWRLGHRPGLDGLRGVAILLVLIGHGLQQYRVGSAAAVGVTLFFALSGYLITGILLGPMRLPAFYARRGVRLAPPLVAMVLVILVVGQIRWTHAIGALTWTQNYAEYHFDTRPFGVTWSLGVEEQFYLLWPFVLAVIPRRHLARTLVVMFAALTAWRLWRAGSGDLMQSYTSVECAGTAMVAGAYVKVRALRLSARWGLLALAALVGLVVEAGQLDGLAWLVVPIFAAVPCAILVASAESLSGWLARPWLVWFGLASYSLYLWHETVPNIFGAEATWWGITVGALVGTVAYYVLERPLMIWRARAQATRPQVPDRNGVAAAPMAS